LFGVNPLMLIFAAPAGIFAGLCAWWIAGAGGSPIDGLRIPSPSPALRQAAGGVSSDDVLKAAGAPLFVLTEGPGAVAEPPLMLQGVVRSPSRAVALISLNGQPARWLAKDERIEGIRLAEIGRSSVLLDLPTRYLAVDLDQPSPSPAKPAEPQHPQRRP